MGEVGSESSDGPDECWIEHGCDKSQQHSRVSVELKSIYSQLIVN